MGLLKEKGSVVGINLYVDIKSNSTLFSARLIFLGMKGETKGATVDVIYAYHMQKPSRIQLMRGVEM